MSGYKRGPKQRGPRNITDEKLKQLFDDIKTKQPSDFKINRPLWDGKAVVEHYENDLEVSYSKHQISKILRDNDFVLRRPTNYAVKRDQAKVDTFTNETHKEIVEDIKKNGGTLVYILMKRKFNRLLTHVEVFLLGKLHLNSKIIQRHQVVA